MKLVNHVHTQKVYIVIMVFTIAIYICREYLLQKRNLSPPDVIKLIEKIFYQ